ncbi:MAG: hypothetical protein DHS20C16_12880 [Phycisphaerae bacterium]|nr:MAG: hypothetical protein DHS20C16_12880 [Phycisphaerae bacterium]
MILDARDIDENGVAEWGDDLICSVIELDRGAGGVMIWTSEGRKFVDNIRVHRVMTGLTLDQHTDNNVALEDAIVADSLADYPMAGIRQVLALARYRNGEFNQAADAAKSEVKLGFENDALTWYVLAASQAKLAIFDEAKESFQQAMDLESNAPENGTCQLEGRWLWCYPKIITTELKSEIEAILAANKE